jgi:galactose mutarotase-like enzyme
MPRLFDYKDFNADELKKRVGRMAQIAGISSFQFIDGRAKGVRALKYNTGSGLEFTVLVDRCMDIYSVNYKGIPIAWQSLAGIVSPYYYEPEGSGWLRSWSGGLMTTCGFEQVGTACEDQGISYGLHGRSGNLPAENVSIEERWEGEKYVIAARGKILQSYFISENYLLTREIRAELGESIIQVHDRVENPGYSDTPFEFLYHINFGFPIVDEGARLIFPTKKITPRDEIAAAGLSDWDKLSAPEVDYQEQVLDHEMIPDRDGFVNAAIVNENIGAGLGVLVRYDYAAFPYFSEWKQMGEGIYSLGFEPGNCHPHGRKKERERGTLQFLKPGESRDFYIEYRILDGAHSIEETERVITEIINSKR